MPELPEVESVVRSLRPRLRGWRIKSVYFPAEQWSGEWPFTLRRLLNAPPQRMREQVAGMRIEEVSRCGKNIVLEIRGTGGARNGSEAMKRGTRRSLWIHLGMTGRLTTESTAEPHSRHTHLIVKLGRTAGSAPADPSSGKIRWLHFADIRRFGRLRVVEEEDAEHAAGLGPEPLEITEAQFVARLRMRKARVKAVLLDQSFVRGLGNIYADESLFRARIYPGRIAAQVRPAQARALYHAIQQVLREAIGAGGSSISNYVDGAGKRGSFQFLHRVYQRTGEPCGNCGAAIRRITIAGRSTHYCPHCQRGPRLAGVGGRRTVRRKLAAQAEGQL